MISANYATRARVNHFAEKSSGPPESKGNTVKTVTIDTTDKEVLLPDFAELVRTGGEEPFLMLFSYHIAPERLAAISAFNEGSPGPEAEP